MIGLALSNLVRLNRTPNQCGLMRAHQNVSSPPRARPPFARPARLWLSVGLILAAVRTTSFAATIVAWGDNAQGQLTIPNSLTNVSTIAAGGFFNLALRSNGTVAAWGTTAAGVTNVPSSATNVMAISAGFGHALVLRSNGTMVVWGDNSLGGATNMPPGLTGIKAIAACGFHSLAVRTNGTIVAWGYNTDGQTNVPAAATNVASVAGGYGSIALRSNGTVIAWGSTYANQANVLPTLTNISAIASGLGHALALRSNGTVVAWGDNFYGQTNPPSVLTNIATITCGAYHSFAIESNGTLYAWGRNTHGQTSSGPTEPFNGILSVAGGDFHSLAFGYLNDDFADRMPLSGTNILMRVSNQNATTEYGIGEPFHHENFTGHTVWFTWTAPASGGVVITATNADGNVATPILAVYSGSALASLTQLTSNSPDSTKYDLARAVFTAVAGQSYQIVFAGDSNFGGGQGYAYLRLNLFPPPANDLFANAAVIAGNYYTSTNSFVGANRESSEPTHGDATLGQTLWWNWTAPTNGPSPLSVRLMADAVSFPPGMGVYTGNSVASLAAVTLSRKTNGMSSEAIFNATPGTTYRIALAGKQTDPDSAAPLFGGLRFRLNCRAFGLTVTNLTSSTNGAGAVTFNANALLQNFTTSASGPLRVSVSAISGKSTTEPLDFFEPSGVTNLGNFPAVSTNLTAGQSVLIPINGVVPAPLTTNSAEPVAFGAYASLQQQPVTNQWFTVDETLITFDKWPGIGEFFGPGGGVIRLDPGYVATSAFNPLASVTMIGPSTAVEGNPASYYGQARYANNFLYNFTNTTWLATRFSITNGVYQPGIVTSNTPVTLSAQFLSSGFLYSAVSNVTVINLPSPSLAQAKVLGGNFTLRVDGVSNRVHVVEATTNLAPPQVWLPLSTNALNASGVWNFTNATGSLPQRFYRAREVE